MPPGSYEEIDLGTYSLAADGVSETWDAGNFQIIAIQVVVTGADAADGAIQPESTLIEEDEATKLGISAYCWDDFELPYTIPAGNSSHTWHVGIYAGKLARLRLNSGSNTAGTVKIIGFGKI